MLYLLTSLYIGYSILLQTCFIQYFTKYNNECIGLGVEEISADNVVLSKNPANNGNGMDPKLSTWEEDEPPLAAAQLEAPTPPTPR